MARKPPKLTVAYSPEAHTSLDEIWDWNARRYGRDHATRYIEFLQNETDKLDTDYLRGRRVPTRPEYRYITIKRRQPGYGHVAIDEIVGDTVKILDYFHTAQNWQAKLAEEE